MRIVFLFDSVALRTTPGQRRLVHPPQEPRVAKTVASKYLFHLSVCLRSPDCLSIACTHPCHRNCGVRSGVESRPWVTCTISSWCMLCSSPGRTVTENVPAVTPESTRHCRERVTTRRWPSSSSYNDLCHVALRRRMKLLQGCVGVSADHRERTRICGFNMFRCFFSLFLTSTDGNFDRLDGRVEMTFFVGIKFAGVCCIALSCLIENGEDPFVLRMDHEWSHITARAYKYCSLFFLRLRVPIYYLCIGCGVIFH